jgi:hypothetical protein
MCPASTATSPRNGKSGWLWQRGRWSNAVHRTIASACPLAVCRRQPVPPRYRRGILSSSLVGRLQIRVSLPPRLTDDVRGKPQSGPCHHAKSNYRNAKPQYRLTWAGVTCAVLLGSAPPLSGCSSSSQGDERHDGLAKDSGLTDSVRRTDGSFPTGAGADSASEAPDASTGCVPTVDWTKLVVQLAGRREIVWDVARRSETEVFPDARISIYRNAAGTTTLTLSHRENYRIVGPSVTALNPRPLLAFSSAAHRTAPQAHYNDSQWIFSPYTFDGTTFWALAHSEWYGCSLYPNDPVKGCRVAVNGVVNRNKSWVNAITLLRSNDGGATWQNAGDASDPSRHVIVGPAPPYPSWDFWSTDRVLNYGVFHPGNLVREGGHLYALVRMNDRDGSGNVTTAGVAMIRHAASVLSARNWQMLDTSGSWVPLTFPPAALADSAPFDHASITFNRPTCRYLQVMFRYPDSTTYVSTSASLAAPDWSPPRPIAGQECFLTRPDKVEPGFVAANYASVIDPSAAGYNLETSGTSPYLYYSTFDPSDITLRSVYRVRLEAKDTPYTPLPLPQGLFRVDAGIYYANNRGHYCAFSDLNSFKRITGRTSATGILVYPGIPSSMVNDGACRG